MILIKIENNIYLYRVQQKKTLQLGNWLRSLSTQQYWAYVCLGLLAEHILNTHNHISSGSVQLIQLKHFMIKIKLNSEKCFNLLNTTICLYNENRIICSSQAHSQLNSTQTDDKWVQWVTIEIISLFMIYLNYNCISNELWCLTDTRSMRFSVCECMSNCNHRKW